MWWILSLGDGKGQGAPRLTREVDGEAD
jgi:hypothetical protein